jgi:hypothetical protein
LEGEELAAMIRKMRVVKSLAAMIREIKIGAVLQCFEASFKMPIVPNVIGIEECDIIRSGANML